MEATMEKLIYEHLVPVWSGNSRQEAAEDCVVPDTMPDVGVILDAEGYVILRSKEAETGFVQLSASVSCWVLYAPEEGGSPRSLEITLPLELRLDAPAVDIECRPVAKIRLRNLEARTVNSRKIALRAEAESEVQCYRKQNLELPAGLAAAEKGVEVLRQSAEILPVADVREKTFVAADDYALPAGCSHVESILTRRAEAVLDDVKYVDGNALFRGRVVSELLLAGEGGRLFPVRCETDFSQIMEIGGGEEARPQVILMLTGVFYDLPEFGRDQSRIGAEIHIAAQCVCRSRQELRYIGDIYSTRTQLIPVSESLRVLSGVSQVSVRQTVTGRAESVPAGGELIRACAAVGGISLEDNTVKTAVNARLLFRSGDGVLSSVRCRFSAELTASEVPEGAVLQDIRVEIVDIYAGMNAGGADVRAVLQMDAAAVTERSIVYVSAVEEDADEGRSLPRAPSVTLVRVPEQKDMWELAKRYRSTSRAILEANEGRKEGLLLIPKGR